ncbi:hypothetical protein BDR05DRAFT_431644 [Suillus weaverae]|nr:hypothetical protein BDR05DRAFT_431644 [Suillus weaverae]
MYGHLFSCLSWLCSSVQHLWTIYLKTKSEFSLYRFCCLYSISICRMLNLWTSLPSECGSILSPLHCQDIDMSVLRARKAGFLCSGHLTDGNVLSALSDLLKTIYFQCVSYFHASAEAVLSIC